MAQLQRTPKGHYTYRIDDRTYIIKRGRYEQLVCLPNNTPYLFMPVYAFNLTYIKAGSKGGSL